MRAWTLVSIRNPIWRALGFGLLSFAVLGTGAFICLGPKPLGPKPEGGVLETGTVGRIGTYTEQLGQGRFLLAYESIVGGEAALQLKGVRGRLEEPETLWLMTSPIAHKAEGVWMMDGPMDVEAREPDGQVLLGKGRIDSTGPALRWDHNIWTGLSALVWDDLQGHGRGRWFLPAGWRRDRDGRFIVEHQPVRWEAAQGETLRSLDAQSLWVTLGFRTGRLERVLATLAGGQIQAQVVDLDPAMIRWTAPIHFIREDGWVGDAQSALAPRPVDEGTVRMIDLKAFEAHRPLMGGTETIQAGGARWTPAGIRAEGDVRWEQPMEGDRLILRAPRVLIREASGDDLPTDLPVGEARAEGLAVLAWGTRSLSSPRMDVRRVQRTWRLQAPVLGRSEAGTFSAGMGRGVPTRWEFDGPIRVNMSVGGNLRGDRLVWETAKWTLTGRPATWNGLRERLSGPKVVWRENNLQFPEGIGGAFAAPEDDVVIRADRGEAQDTQVTLAGRVDCQGQGWHLLADRVSISMDPNNRVRSMIAKGAVTLRGKISEGKGESLELDLENRVARWQGKVKGMAEVQP